MNDCQRDIDDATGIVGLAALALGGVAITFLAAYLVFVAIAVVGALCFFAYLWFAEFCWPWIAKHWRSWRQYRAVRASAKRTIARHVPGGDWRCLVERDASGDWRHRSTYRKR